MFFKKIWKVTIIKFPPKFELTTNGLVVYALTHRVTLSGKEMGKGNIKYLILLFIFYR